MTRTKAMADRGDVAVYRLGPPSVHVNGGRALAELPLVIEWRIDVNGVEADLASTARATSSAPTIGAMADPSMAPPGTERVRPAAPHPHHPPGRLGRNTPCRKEHPS
ncbi:hypothetical protein STBA_03030 [Streptomyces sp. MP131-18]|nr:hypothetical protein STBA_03030 [Streptomyces sp. MP131-18]